jgi:hypothetical protein
LFTHVQVKNGFCRSNHIPEGSRYLDDPILVSVVEPRHAGSHIDFSDIFLEGDCLDLGFFSNSDAGFVGDDELGS